MGLRYPLAPYVCEYGEKVIWEIISTIDCITVWYVNKYIYITLDVYLFFTVVLFVAFCCCTKEKKCFGIIVFNPKIKQQKMRKH